MKKTLVLGLMTAVLSLGIFQLSMAHDPCFTRCYQNYEACQASATPAQVCDDRFAACVRECNL